MQPCSSKNKFVQNIIQRNRTSKECSAGPSPTLDHRILGHRLSELGDFRHNPNSTFVYKPFCVLYFSGLNILKISDVLKRVMETNCDVEFLGTDYKNETYILNSVALVRERTIPTERPPPVGEVSANLCG